MNKEAILKAISQALDSVAFEPDGDEFGESEEMEGNEMPIWSKMDVGKLGQTSGPIHDKSALLGMDRTSKPPQVDNYGMPMAGDQEEMMVALGLI